MSRISLPGNSAEINVWSLLLLSLVILSCLLVSSPGTIDVTTWMSWTKDYLDYGPVAGYIHNNTDYPPLMIFIFYVFTKGLAGFGIDSFMAIKLAILFFSLLATLLVLLWTKNHAITALFHFAFILDTVCLGYADVILGCFLIFSLWQLQKGNIVLFATAFSLAIFIKWQALIISPFLFLFLLRPDNKTGANIAVILKSVLLPFFTISTVIIYIFSFDKLLYAFVWAAHHPWPSANALNVNWILTFFYHSYAPDIFGNLRDGEILYIKTENMPAASQLSRLLFLLLFGATMFKFYRSRKTFEELLVFSLAAYLMYFTFNTGVHENHLFLAVILCVILASINTHYRIFAFGTIAAFNINLLLFYGVTGRMPFSRVILHTLDVTLVIAVVNVLVFCYMWYVLVISSALPSASEKQTAALPH